MKTVFTSFTTDNIHEGHLNIIREAQKYGKVIIGALSDRTLVRINRYTTMPQEERTDRIDGVVFSPVEEPL